MHTLHAIIACLGLGLIVLSCSQINQVQQYQTLVRGVQSTAGDLYQHALKLRPKNMSILISPSMESVLSELDSAKKLERGWWAACATGAVVFIAGVVGVITDLLRRRSANQVLEATAG
jgi:hypothetical protein